MYILIAMHDNFFFFILLARYCNPLYVDERHRHRYEVGQVDSTGKEEKNWIYQRNLIFCDMIDCPLT